MGKVFSLILLLPDRLILFVYSYKWADLLYIFVYKLLINLQKQKNKCIFDSARNSNSWYHPNMNGPITGHFHQKKESNFVSAAHLDHNKTSRWSCCNCVI